MLASRVAAAASSVRHSIARAPWPTWGSSTSGGKTSTTAGVRPSRSRAALAMTMAAKSAAFSSRVAMLPRSSAKFRSGRRWARWARRRTEPVAMIAPAGRSAQRAPTNTSRGSARSGMATSTRPGVAAAGRSLAECTAKSARPLSTAACTSFTNTPWPPIWCRGVVWFWSPVVSTTTVSISTSGLVWASSSATRLVCQRASALPRVAARRSMKT